jgi:hypothetical protein
VRQGRHEVGGVSALDICASVPLGALRWRSQLLSAAVFRIVGSL